MLTDGDDVVLSKEHIDDMPYIPRDFETRNWIIIWSKLNDSAKNTKTQRGASRGTENPLSRNIIRLIFAVPENILGVVCFRRDVMLTNNNNNRFMLFL